METNEKKDTQSAPADVPPAAPASLRRAEPKRGAVGKIIPLALLAAALALGVYVVWWLDTSPRTDDAYVFAHTVKVTPEVSGTIIDMPVKDSQFVKKGGVLFQIDPAPYTEILAKAEAAMKVLDEQIILASRAVSAQEFSAGTAKINVDNAEIALAQARSTYQRLAPLLKNGYASAEQVEQARTALNAATALRDAAVSQASAAEAAVSSVAALEAQRDVVRADISLARINLERATVRAPFDGIVTALRTSEGAFASAGFPTFTLINTEHWFVFANFRETELPAIRKGQAATVYLLTDSSKRFAGTVESVGFGVLPDDGGLILEGLPKVSRSINWVHVAQRFPVKILVHDPDPELFRIGASAVAILKDAEK